MYPILTPQVVFTRFYFGGEQKELNLKTKYLPFSASVALHSGHYKQITAHPSGLV